MATLPARRYSAEPLRLTPPTDEPEPQIIDVYQHGQVIAQIQVTGRYAAAVAEVIEDYVRGAPRYEPVPSTTTRARFRSRTA